MNRGGHLDLPEPEISEPQNRELSEALGLLFGITFALLILESVLPFLGSYSQGILALALVLIPGFALRKSAQRPEELGTQMGPWRKTGVYTLLTCLIMTVLFLPGFHLFKTQVQGTELSLSWDQLSRWDDDIRAMPSSRQNLRPPAKFAAARMVKLLPRVALCCAVIGFAPVATYGA
jgi:hypothetical protein